MQVKYSKATTTTKKLKFSKFLNLLSKYMNCYFSHLTISNRSQPKHRYNVHKVNIEYKSISCLNLDFNPQKALYVYTNIPKPKTLPA